MEAVVYLIGVYLILLLPWAAFSSPIIATFAFLVWLMSRKAARSVVKVAALALAFTLLAAPVPTPIITFLIPHGLALFGGTYYRNVLQGPAIMAQLWWWIIPSLVITFIVSYAVAWRFGRPPNNSFKGKPLRGSP